MTEIIIIEHIYKKMAFQLKSYKSGMKVSILYKFRINLSLISISDNLYLNVGLKRGTKNE